MRCCRGGRRLKGATGPAAIDLICGGREPAEYVARLRNKKTDANPLLFHINMKDGHGGKSGRFERLNDIAREYVFFLDLAGARGVN